MSEIRPELHLWVAYLEKKEQLEEAQDRIAELEAALRFYVDDENRRRNGQLDPNSGNFTGGPARAALAGGKKDEAAPRP